MAGKSIFFAGGGTGGHIYPALAIAEKIAELDPAAKIHFFISSRDIDKHVLSKTAFEYTALPAVGLSIRPDRFSNFYKMFLASQKIAAEMITRSENPVVVGVGGFVAAPVCRAAYKSKIPLLLLNVDIIPGKANKLIGKWAQRNFVQFEETKIKSNRHRLSFEKQFQQPEPAKSKRRTRPRLQQKNPPRNRRLNRLAEHQQNNLLAARKIIELRRQLADSAFNRQGKLRPGQRRLRKRPHKKQGRRLL
jgi:UDP-N-acetylglucosamine:LPS N-acetylglucosamine transferase